MTANLIALGGLLIGAGGMLVIYGLVAALAERD